MTKEEQLGKRKRGGKTSAKKKAWHYFSLFIRTRDCIESNNSIEEGFCYTCNKLTPLKGGQCGHFLPGRNNKVLFDPIQTHLQDYHCNVGLSGNWPEYLKHMVKDHGQEAVDKMLDEHNEMVKYSLEDYEELEQTFKNDYEELVRCFNLNKPA